MMARLIAWLTHRDRQDRTDTLVHAMRNQAQVAELERHQLQKAREQNDLMWLEDALTRRVRREERETP
jgi:hypothetical protein